MKKIMPKHKPSPLLASELPGKRKASLEREVEHAPRKREPAKKSSLQGARRIDPALIEEAAGFESMVFYLSFALLALAETALLFNAGLGLTVHAAFVIALIAGVSWAEKRAEETGTPIKERFMNASGLLKALLLLPLIRIFAFTLPLTYLRQVYWPMVISIPLLLALAVLARNMRLSASEVGLVWGRPATQAAIALSGIVFGSVEFLILRPASLASSLNPFDMLVPAIGFIAFTGLSEELVFRGVIQGFAQKVYGGMQAILYSAALFTLMHSSYNSAYEMAFILAAGLFYGYAFYKTRSIAGIALSHGIANIVLFLVAPLYL